MNNGRKAWSTEKSRGEPSEGQTNKESRKRRSWHCGTIHHQITEASKGAQYGTLKIPLGAKVTNDTFERAPETSCLSRDTPIPHRRLFRRGSGRPNPLTSSFKFSSLCAPEFHLVGARLRLPKQTRLGSVHLPGDARRTLVRRSRHLSLYDPKVKGRQDEKESPLTVYDP
ncbi:hypothetical protein CDL15_Pgr023281 [Punica granatum]|uniref:Uncharacterized protein n=1 Tax=Punica granatum TaxID=22663 RepID=A0A218WJQ4_PUNGR|nr:hypothetical protein CDL15_Pgr023281 [Punica granatum]